MNMKGIFSLFILLMSLTCVGQGTNGKHLADTLRENTVRIYSNTSFGGRSQHYFGYGFIIGETSNDFLIVTADHVVRGDYDGAPGDNDSLSIKFYNLQGNWFNAELTEIHDYAKDFALIKAPKPDGQTWISDCVAPENEVNVEDKTWFIGRRGNIEWYVTEENSDDYILEIESSNHEIILSSDHIYETSSGGPVVSGSGIIGMIVSKDSQGDLARIRSIEYILSKVRESVYRNNLTIRRLSPHLLTSMQIIRSSKRLRPKKQVRLRWRDPGRNGSYKIQLVVKDSTLVLEDNYRDLNSSDSIIYNFNEKLPDLDSFWIGRGRIEVLAKNGSARPKAVTIGKKLTDAEKYGRWIVGGGLAGVAIYLSGILECLFNDCSDPSLEPQPGPPDKL